MPLRQRRLPHPGPRLRWQRRCHLSYAPRFRLSRVRRLPGRHDPRRHRSVLRPSDCRNRALQFRFSPLRRTPRRVRRLHRYRVRRLHSQPGTCRLARSTDRVLGPFSRGLANRSRVERCRAARFCRVHRDRARRCRSVPACSPNRSKALRASRADILCARRSQASRPRDLSCRRVPIWSRVLPNSRRSRLRASPSLPVRACLRLGVHFTRARAQGSRLHVLAGRAIRWVPAAVRPCAGEGRTRPRR